MSGLSKEISRSTTPGASAGPTNSKDTGPTAGKNGYQKKGQKPAAPSLDASKANPMNNPPSTFGINGV